MRPPRHRELSAVQAAEPKNQPSRAETLIIEYATAWQYTEILGDWKLVAGQGGVVESFTEIRECSLLLPTHRTIQGILLQQWPGGCDSPPPRTQSCRFSEWTEQPGSRNERTETTGLPPNQQTMLNTYVTETRVPDNDPYGICGPLTQDRLLSSTPAQQPDDPEEPETWGPDPDEVCHTEIEFTQISSRGNERQALATGTGSPPCEEPETWGPDPDTVCETETFEQTSSRGNTQLVRGTARTRPPCEDRNDPTETWSPDPASMCYTAGWITQTSNRGATRMVLATGTAQPPCSPDGPESPGPWTPGTDTACPNEEVFQTRDLNGNAGISSRTVYGTRTGPPCDMEPAPGPWEPPASGYCTTDDVVQTRTVTSVIGGVTSTTEETQRVKGTAITVPPCTVETWSPNPEEVCYTAGMFLQTSNLGNERFETATGTSPAVCTDNPPTETPEPQPPADPDEPEEPEDPPPQETWSPDPASVCHTRGNIQQTSSLDPSRTRMVLATGTDIPPCVEETWAPDPASKCVTEGWFTQISNLGNEREVRATGTDYPPCREPGPWTPSTDTKCPNEFVDQRREMYGNTGIDFRSEAGTKTGPPCDEEPDEGPWEPPASAYCTTDDVNQRRTVTKTQGGVISTTVETRTVKGTATTRPPCELEQQPPQGEWGSWIDVTLASDICSGETYYPRQRREHTNGEVEYRVSDTPRVGTKSCTTGMWRIESFIGMEGVQWSGRLPSRELARPGDFCRIGDTNKHYLDSAGGLWLLGCVFSMEQPGETTPGTLPNVPGAGTGNSDEQPDELD